MLRASTHWLRDGTSVSMLVEDMSRNKCFFQIRISHVLRFISICNPFTDSRSFTHHIPMHFHYSCLIKHMGTSCFVGLFYDTFGLTPCCNSLVLRIVTLKDLWQNIKHFIFNNLNV
jgi:hypothetical protein